MKQTKKIMFIKRKGASIIILAFSLIAILGLSSLVVDLGMILNRRYELQKAVESAALISASEYELYESDQDTAGDFRLRFPPDAKINNSTTGVAGINYKKLKDTNQFLQYGTDTVNISFDKDSRAVKVEATATVHTYIISILGIKKIKIYAKAAAVNVPVYLSRLFPKPNGSILSGENDLAVPGPDYKDTEIHDPLGSDTTGGAHPTGTAYNRNNKFDNIYGPPDSKSLSLGPGGFITIKLPATIYDGKGADFIIYERGNAEGYFVFAGIDVNPANPYIDAANPGGGIKWINVSCTGIPLYAKMDDDETIGSYRTTVSVNGSSYTVYKFYGSGLFDLGDRCDSLTDGAIYDPTQVTTAPSIKNVKYLKIIDDNMEDGFFLQPRLNFTNHPNSTTNTEHGIPMIMPGEHSTFTPGADIDAIAILHHSRLISLADYAKDTDGDRLIDVKERMLGLNPNNVDTDGDGKKDMIEYEGDEPETAYGYGDTPQDESTQDDVTTLFKEYPTKAFEPPIMEIKP